MKSFIQEETLKKGDRTPYDEFRERGNDRAEVSNEELKSPCQNLDLGILRSCLLYHRQTGEPLPYHFLTCTLLELDLAASGRESRIFMKPAGTTKRKTHPIINYLQRLAVSYVRSAITNGWDSKPAATAARACGVNVSTIHAWKRKYPGNEIPCLDTKEEADIIIETLISTYAIGKKI